MTWMIYGANGYTGRLVADLARVTPHPPVLAGRSPAVVSLAAELGLESRLADLAAPDVLDEALGDVDVVLHCAGPFVLTSRPMVEACLRTGTSYLDITGEAHVFEDVYSRHEDARDRGVALVPGVGFDVVPSDHLLVQLHAELPEAVRADVALISRGGFSRGTIRTVIDGMREGGLVRRGGRLVVEPMARDRVTVVGSRRPVVLASVPLGDVSSGFRATGIPHLTDYSTVPVPRAVAAAQPVLRRVLAADRVAEAVARLAGRVVAGPSESVRDRTRSDVVVRLVDGSGQEVTGAISVPNTYDFTARSALHAVRHVLAGDIEPGAWTPAQAFGADFCRTVPGVEVVDLSRTLQVSR